jgi:RNA polymerase sigma-70 factor (ECF subfamily)
VGYRYWKSRADAAEHVDCVATLAAPASQLKADEAAELLHAMLAQLSPRDRLVLTLMYLEEMPVAKVAELTGWTKTMVKVQAFRAKAKLKKLLKKEHLS